MAEMLSTENSIRKANGDDLLEKAPVLTKILDEIPYDSQLTSYSLPYFLASFISKDDDSDAWAQEFRNRYIVSLVELMQADTSVITDYYS